MKIHKKSFGKGQPFNDHSNFFKDWTDVHLISCAQEAHETMRLSHMGVGCHGVGDVMRLEGALNELEARGYEIEEESKLCITKGDKDEE